MLRVTAALASPLHRPGRRPAPARFAAPHGPWAAVASGPRLRPADHPDGLPRARANWQREWDQHNRSARVAVALVAAAREAGVLVMVENPADRGGSPEDNPA